MLSSICNFTDDKSQKLNFWSLSTYYGAYDFVARKKGAQDNDRYVTIYDDGSVHFKYGNATQVGEVEYSFVGPH